MSDYVDWSEVETVRHKDAWGFTCTPACGSRGRTDCQCSYCQVLDMMFSLSCPFCAAQCGATPDEEGQELVKTWLGKHLANTHQELMEAYLNKHKKPVPEDTNEYARRVHPSGYIYTV